MSRDIPALFSAPMIQAMLAGRKANTRRLAFAERKTRNPAIGESPTYVAASAWQRVQPGDRLWIREEWRVSKKWDAMKPADLPPRTMTVIFGAGGSISNQADGGWRPDSVYPPAGPFPDWVGRRRASMHLPRWASRLTLIVTGVKIEPLQNISVADAFAEGIERRRLPVDGVETTLYSPDFDSWADDDPVRAFQLLWIDINGPRAWDANPDVVCIAFTVINANIDAIEARAA